VFNFEELSEGKSFIHLLDPRIKIAITAFFSTTVALTDSFLSLIPAAFLSFVLIFFTGLKWKVVFRRVLPVYGFMILIWFSLPFTISGTGLFSLGRLQASREGIIQAFRITIKFTAILFMIISLIATIRVSALFHALNHFRVPKKLVYLTMFCYRYIHVLHREYLRLLNAMKIRGFKPKTGIHTYRSYAYLVGMLLVRSYDRSERVYKAMLCRGFRGTFYMLDHFVMEKKDLYFLALSFIYIAGVILIECYVRIIL